MTDVVSSWSAWWLVPVFILYLYLVAAMRNLRAHALPRRLKMRKRADFAKMTTDEAQFVLKELTELEFPQLMRFSTIFALFKAYGIPSVSSLLVTTEESTSKETFSKRIADTGVLISEFTLNKPSSERSIKSIARINYLHDRYQKDGKIKNSDMLYTISLFALEPIRWINKYEWRALTDLELCASGTFWKAMGDAMNISYDELPSSATGWRDGLHWLEEIWGWSVVYEKEHMIPADSNHQLANAYLDVLFFNLPTSLNLVGKKVVSVLIGERLRSAMMLPIAGPLYHHVINGALDARKLVLTYLALPRPGLLRKNYLADFNKTTGRYNAKEYLSFPWYVKPTIARRWGRKAWLLWLLRRRLPGDDGNKYVPEGYAFTEVGPASQVGKGVEEMEEIESRLRAANRADSPFISVN